MQSLHNRLSMTADRYEQHLTPNQLRRQRRPSDADLSTRDRFVLEIENTTGEPRNLADRRATRAGLPRDTNAVIASCTDRLAPKIASPTTTGQLAAENREQPAEHQHRDRQQPPASAAPANGSSRSQTRPGRGRTRPTSAISAATVTDIYRADLLPKLPTTLRELSISLYNDSGDTLLLSDVHLRRLPELAGLHKLALSSVGTLSLETLRSMAERLPALQEFELWSSQGANNGLATLLEPFENLDRLLLNKVEQLDQEALRELCERDLHSLEIRNCANLPASSWADIGTPKLRNICLYGQELSGEDLAAIADLPDLVELRLQPGTHYNKCTRHDLEAGLLTTIADSRSLLRFDPGRPLRADEANALAAMPSLQQLIVHLGDVDDLAELTALGTSKLGLVVVFEDIDRVSDALLTELPKVLPNCRSIALDQGGVYGRGTGFSAEGLAQIGRLSQLRRLFIRGSWPFKTPDLAFIQELHNLEVLELRLYKVSAGIAGSLKHLSKLRALSLTNIKISDGAAKKLVKLPLQGIEFDCGKIGDRGLESLASIPQLRKLRFSYLVGDVSDSGLAKLSLAPELRELEIAIKTVTPAGFAALAACPSLEKLHMSIDPNVRISDEHIASLSASPTLQTLSISVGCDLKKLSDEALTDLAAMRSLQLLDLPKRDHEGNFSDEARARFEAPRQVLLTTTGNQLFSVDVHPAQNAWLRPQEPADGDS